MPNIFLAVGSTEFCLGQISCRVLINGRVFGCYIAFRLRNQSKVIIISTSVWLEWDKRTTDNHKGEYLAGNRTQTGQRILATSSLSFLFPKSLNIWWVCLESMLTCDSLSFGSELHCVWLVHRTAQHLEIKMRQHINGNPLGAEQCGWESLTENECEEVRIHHWLFLGLQPVKTTLVSNKSDEIGSTKEGRPASLRAPSLSSYQIYNSFRRDMWSCWNEAEIVP